MVPPVVNPGSCDICKVSAMTPWPVIAASPWMMIGRVAYATGFGAVLFGADDPFEYGIDGIEMRRVGGHRHGDLLAAGVLVAAGGAEVILDVAGSFGVIGALELAEDLVCRSFRRYWSAR